MKPFKHIGFVATRISGTDGVSLETHKWRSFFEDQMGMSCAFMAGLLDTPPERSLPVPEAGLTHPEVRRVYDRCFGHPVRDPETSALIHSLKDRLKESLYAFVDRFSIDLLVVENALAIPMNLPLGVALAEFISETGMATIAHHHDFFWERERFLNNGVWDCLAMAFPPRIPFIKHVVINSAADNQLSLRTGISATVVPNVMDFAHPPDPPDAYAADVREALGVRPDQVLVLQPTRVVKRKGIEHAVELVHRLNKRMDREAVLVISHAAGDEGDDYAQRIRDYSALMHVRTLFVSDRVQDYRGMTAEGDKIYCLDDVYPHADLVTYPSTFEGFGNAFLEAIYFGKPIVVNMYSIYKTDIKPKRFQTIEIDGYVTEEAVARTLEVLQNAQHRRRMTEHNYRRARHYFSYQLLHCKLRDLLNEC